MVTLLPYSLNKFDFFCPLSAANLVTSTPGCYWTIFFVYMQIYYQCSIIFQLQKYIRARHNHFTETSEGIIKQCHQDSPYCADSKPTDVIDCNKLDDMDRFMPDSPSLDCGFLDDNDEYCDEFDSRSCVSQMALIISA